MSGELSNLKAPKGANRSRRIKARGISAGQGKTAGRGYKGQKSRKSGHVRIGFEGGQTPIQRRLPKRGFKNIFSKSFAEVQLDQLLRFDEGMTVDPDLFVKIGLMRKKDDGVKVLVGRSDFKLKLNLKVHRISARAKEIVEAAGGTVELIPDKEKWVRTDTRAQRRAAAK